MSIALGFGNNIDYEINLDARTLEALVHEFAIDCQELKVGHVIASKRDLIISILSFMQKGSGGERIVASSASLELFAGHFDTKVTLGGTSPRAAIALHHLGVSSALHLVTTNDHVRRLLPEGVSYLCSSAQDSLYPHLIVQYAKGMVVKARDVEICTKQANRIIYHRDEDNMAMAINPAFVTYVRGARALLVSGFNAMVDDTLLLQRIPELAGVIAELPGDALVFYEDAGYPAPHVREAVLKTLWGRRLVISLNEDELHTQAGHELDILDARSVQDALLLLQLTMPDATIVLHTMYWALAFGADAQAFQGALKEGVTMATTRFCFGDDFSLQNHDLIKARPANEAGARFSAQIQELLAQQVCCLAVPFVEQAQGTTVGLGDAFVGGFLSVCCED